MNFYNDIIKKINPKGYNEYRDNIDKIHNEMEYVINNERNKRILAEIEIQKEADRLFIEQEQGINIQRARKKEY